MHTVHAILIRNIEESITVGAAPPAVLSACLFTQPRKPKEQNYCYAIAKIVKCVSEPSTLLALFGLPPLAFVFCPARISLLITELVGVTKVRQNGSVDLGYSSVYRAQKLSRGCAFSILLHSGARL